MKILQYFLTKVFSYTYSKNELHINPEEIKNARKKKHLYINKFYKKLRKSI